MGNFIWHEPAPYSSITASLCKLAIRLLNYIVINLTNTDTVWAGFFALVYRRFFWHFVNGTLRNSGGIQCVFQTSFSCTVSQSLFSLIRTPRPAKQDGFFIDIIVKAPVIPIFSIILGHVIVALEYPAPFMKGLAAQRSFIFRVVLLFFQAFHAILFYQVRFLPISLCHRMTVGVPKGTNGAIWSLVAILGYSRAMMLGEVMKEAEDNKARTEHA